MKLTLEETLKLPAGNECRIVIECEGGQDTQRIMRDVGAALLHRAGDEDESRAEDGPRSQATSNGGTRHTLHAEVGEPSHEARASPETETVPEVKVHGKAKKTVHKILLALDQRANRGTPATVDDIERGTGLSRPAIYRTLDPDTPQGQYARGLMRVSKDGHAYAIDITSAGRTMASRLRTRPL